MKSFEVVSLQKLKYFSLRIIVSILTACLFCNSEKNITTSQYLTEEKHWKEKLTMSFHWWWSWKCCCFITHSTVAGFHLCTNSGCSLLLSTVAVTQVKLLQFVSGVCNMYGICSLSYISLCCCQQRKDFRLVEATSLSLCRLFLNTLSQVCRNLHGNS